MYKWPKQEIWLSFAFLLVCAPPPSEYEQDGISLGQKETEQESLKQQNLSENIPQRSTCLPCGRDVFVRPSPLITIMSPDISVRAEFLCLCVFSKMSGCEFEDASHEDNMT